jgi:flagellar protein FlbD
MNESRRGRPGFAPGPACNGKAAPATEVFILLSRGRFLWNQRMIQLTRLNGQAFVVNAEKIRYVESTPDTLVCTDHGEKLMVRESLQEVIQRAIDYARTIRRPITD